MDFIYTYNTINKVSYISNEPCETDFTKSTVRCKL